MTNNYFFRLMKFALFVIFPLVVSVQSNPEDTVLNPETSSSSSSWAKLQISPDTLGSMKYGNYRVDIYEHSKNQNPNTPSNRHKYYYAPIALLDHKSATSYYNEVTKNPEMKFRIEMWNQNVTEEVVLHLKQILGHQVSEDQVEVIPLEKVILVNLSPSSSFSLSNNWNLAIRHHQDIWFTLSCLALKVCDKLATTMRTKPEQFHNFKLYFSLSSQTSQTKQTVIRIETITSGQMVNDLLQKYGSETKEVFLTASDEKRMLTQTATNIRLDTFDDTEVGSSNSEAQIYNMLKEMLISSTTIIKEQSDKMWDSVFWNDDNYRPDKTTQTLNNVYKKMDKINQKKLADSYNHTMIEKSIKEASKSGSREKTSSGSKSVSAAQSKNIGGSVSGSGFGISASVSANHGTSSESGDSQSKHLEDKSDWSNLVKADFDSDFSRHGSTSREGIERFYEESKDHVQWNGEKFVPKPMQLSRINLAKFRDTQSFQDKKVTVRYTAAVLSTPINLVKYAGLTVTDEWNNLKRELKTTEDRLKGTWNWIRKISNGLNKTTTDFMITKKETEACQMKLESATIELLKMNSTVYALTTKLNDLTNKFTSTEKELTSTKSTVVDLKEKIDARTKEVVDIGRMPTSCADLQRMGQTISGFFSVKGPRKMEMFYCDFQNRFYKRIGYADVKSASVHFYVQRNSSFATVGTPITFEVAHVNEENAMNLTTGVFTAPWTGIYFFSFTGLAHLQSSAVNLQISLYLNGGLIGRDLVEEANTGTKQLSPVTLQSTLNLKSGDRVWVAINWMSSGAYLFDNHWHHTHFTGFLLEEEIAVSL